VTRGLPTVGGLSVTYEYQPVFYSYGANWFVDEGKNWTPAVNADAAQAGTAVFRRLLEQGPPKPQTVGQADVINLMQGGQAFQGHFVAAGAAQIEDPQRSSVVGKVGYAVVPAGSTGKSAPTSGTWTLCVPAARPAENQKAAADFIMWMLDKKQQEDFVRAGGIPSRNDVSEAFDSKTRPYLDALMASMPTIRRSPRYVFAAAMDDATEQNLSRIGAGEVTVKAGLDRLQAQLTEIVTKAGFLHT
jgi:multiple sugar transport system substrate-binding protein